MKFPLLDLPLNCVTEEPRWAVIVYSDILLYDRRTAIGTEMGQQSSELRTAVMLYGYS